MKKFSIIFLVIIVLATALCGCGKSNPEDNPTPSQQEDIHTEIDISLFKEVETTSENIDIYRQEVWKRLDSLQEGEEFISEKEWDAITTGWPYSEDILEKFSLGFTELDTLYKSCTEYYYPVVFRTGDSLVVWYTDHSGSVMLKKVHGHWSEGNYLGQLHSDSDEAFASRTDYTFTYNQETGSVNMWKLNELAETYTLPANSVYCGFSEFEGYIFRSGTDVYALQTDRINTVEDGWKSYWKVICIAHNVKYVIDADYRAASDPWSQPLFLMTDGTVKVYVRWEGDYQDIRDHESHLVDLYYEGGIGV